MEMKRKKNGDNFSEQESKLLDLLPKKDEHDVGDLSEALGVSSEEIIRIAASLEGGGYRITYDGARNVIRLVGENENGEIKYPDIGKVLNHFKVAFITDTRMGAKQEQMSLLNGVYRLFARLGVSFVVHAGNVVVGKPDSGKPLNSISHDTFLRSSEEQRDFVLKHFPRLGKKIKTYMVAGRRDLTFRGRQAYSIIQDICRRRKDLVYWGDKERTFEVRGLKFKVINPYDDNGPMGKSYGVQQIAKSIDNPDNPHPDILVVAGMHRFGLIPDYWNDGRGDVYFIASMHAQMARQRNKRAPVRPDIGVLILDIDFNEIDDKGRPKIIPTGYNLNPYADYSETEHLEPYPESPDGDLSPDESKILERIHESEFGVTIGALSRHLKSNRKKIEKSIKHLKELGHPIEVPEDIKRVIIKRVLREKFPTTEIEIVREVEFGDLSDTHLTSTHQQIGLLRRTYVTFGERSIKVVFHAGDVSDGPPSSGYRGHGRDVVLGNSDDILDYMVSKYPRVGISGERSPSTTHMIGGNHDAWWITAGGLDVIKAFASRRRDIKYLGSEYGSVVIDGMYHYLLHPRGGAGDTISQKIEKFMDRARNLRSKGRGYPRVFSLGNWHRAFVMFDQDILGFLVPCLKSEDSFHTTLALVPKLGFWITKVGLDKAENIISFSPEYFGFTEEDIDPGDYEDIHKHETVRARRKRREAKKLIRP